MPIKYLSLSEAAKIVGMPDKTLTKWLKERELDLLREKVMIYIDSIPLFDEDMIHIIAADLKVLEADLNRYVGEWVTQQRRN